MSPLSPPRPARRWVVTTVLMTGALAACGSEADEPAPTSTTTGGHPVTIENCGPEVGFDAAPERVVLLKSSSVPFLHELGVLDRVTARAGQYPAEYYDDETLAELEAVPLLTDELDSSGHLQIEREPIAVERMGDPNQVTGHKKSIGVEPIALVEATDRDNLGEEAIGHQAIGQCREDRGRLDVIQELANVTGGGHFLHEERPRLVAETAMRFFAA